VTQSTDREMSARDVELLDDQRYSFLMVLTFLGSYSGGATPQGASPKRDGAVLD